uniref:EG1 protein n=1 Tax=Schwanniomyces occidentalis var. occidentalis TaxID=4947 RepID=Q09091_SCHOC|nr:EG1 [Schwanniomyces occidentalis var. occidentalis]
MKRMILPMTKINSWSALHKALVFVNIVGIVWPSALRSYIVGIRRQRSHDLVCSGNNISTVVWILSCPPNEIFLYSTVLFDVNPIVDVSRFLPISTYTKSYFYQRRLIRPLKFSFPYGQKDQRTILKRIIPFYLINSMIEKEPVSVCLLLQIYHQLALN